MERPKLEDFKREVNDGQDYADWFQAYYQALEMYSTTLENEIRELKSKIVHVCDVCGSSDVIEAPHMGKNCNRCHPIN